MQTRDDLILSHLQQVDLLARRLHRRCPQVELDDLISAGTIGLIQAVDRFDPRRRCKLRTLAEHRILGAMLDYLRQIDPLPREVRRFQKRRDAILESFSLRGEPVRHDEVARQLGISTRKYIEQSRMIVAADAVRLSDLSESVLRRVL